MRMNPEELDQKNWGVCGFVAACQAAYYNGHPEMILDTSYATLFTAVSSFCENNQGMSKELLDFNNAFGVNYAYKDLNEVIGEMNKDKEMKGKFDQQNKGIGIAMSGNAMMKLCKKIGLKNAEFHGTTSTTNSWNKRDFPYSNTIYGMGNKGKKRNYRYGLLHWIYVDAKGNPMTWGLTGSAAINELQKDYDKVTHYIPL